MPATSKTETLAGPLGGVKKGRQRRGFAELEPPKSFSFRLPILRVGEDLTNSDGMPDGEAMSSNACPAAANTDIYNRCRALPVLISPEPLICAANFATDLHLDGLQTQAQHSRNNLDSGRTGL